MNGRRGWTDSDEKVIKYGLAAVRGYLQRINQNPNDIFMLVAYQHRYTSGDHTLQILSGTSGCPRCIAEIAGQTMINNLSDGILELRMKQHFGSHAGD